MHSLPLGYQYALGVHGRTIPWCWTILKEGLCSLWSEWFCELDYKLGLLKTGGNLTTWDNSNAVIAWCVMEEALSRLLRLCDNQCSWYFLGSSSTSYLDQNGDGFNDGNKPSCSWYQGQKMDWWISGMPSAPDRFKWQHKDCSSQLFKVEWISWSLQDRVRANLIITQQHQNKWYSLWTLPCWRGAPGTGTGGMHMVAGLPNRALNTSIWMTSVGAVTTVRTLAEHNYQRRDGNESFENRQCSNCHNDNNKLSVHAVPTGAFAVDGV